MRERFGHDPKCGEWCETLELMYVFLRERATSETGLLLEPVKVEAPDWCRFHDSNGDEREQGAFAAAQKAYRAGLCYVNRLTSVSELDDWLMEV